MTGCVFCAIVAGNAPAVIVNQSQDSMEIITNRPVTEGHTIVLPRTHVQDALTEPTVTGRTYYDAARWAARHESVNLITSAGSAATQTVFHLHVHIVPRTPRDGLHLPWTQGGHHA